MSDTLGMGSEVRPSNQVQIMKNLKDIAAALAAMTPEARAETAACMPLCTIEGHALSLRNTIMVSMQAGDLEGPATVVGGFRQWLAAGRCVRKGQHAMYILHPCHAKGGDDSEEGKLYFRETPVFDISQTDALPALAIAA